MRHALRILLVTLALVLLGLALAPRAVPAQAGPCDTTRLVPHWWSLRPASPCAGDDVTLYFGSCRNCVDATGWEWADRDTGVLHVAVRMPARCPATEECVLDTLAIPLGRLAAGAHSVLYALEVSVAAGDSSGACSFVRHGSVSFDVCAPASPCDSLPYVSVVQIGAPVDCGDEADCEPRICAGDPIPLHLSGWFPDGCHAFRGLELLPGPEAGPRPGPPIVRIRVRKAVCSACTMALVPWSADTTLAGLPGGSYALRLELVRTDYCGGEPVDTLYCADARAFAVADSCGTGGPCVMAGWAHPDGPCDDTIVPGGRAKVVLTAQSSVPLAGLQGTLRLAPAGLRVADLVPVGPAAGMHVTWEPAADGARFVMFAEQGAPVGGVRCTTGTRCVEPVLGVVLVPGTDAALPAVTHVRATDLLGADSLGREVPECQVATLVAVEARVCAGTSCDFNGDGRLDVRDLVVMVHCVLGNGVCPDSTLAHHDCDSDGDADLDDVLCCARRLLRGGERDSVPGRAEPGVAVDFGEPAWEAGGLLVPIRIRAADRIGAARLALALPLDRYDVTGVEVGVANPQWLALHEAVDGQVVLGLVGLGPDVPAEEPETLDLTLHLAPHSGAGAGGEIALADLQASGRDGATLELSTSPAAVPLPPPAVTALSARPNPFAGSTRLALALERGAEVEVAVLDLTGRRVATLFHGPLPAGLHEFAGSGARSDGGRAAHGVYFVQARVDGRRLAQKLVLLRGE